jgi:hypothetical protein
MANQVQQLLYPECQQPSLQHGLLQHGPGHPLVDRSLSIRPEIIKTPPSSILRRHCALIEAQCVAAGEGNFGLFSAGHLILRGRLRPVRLRCKIAAKTDLIRSDPGAYFRKVFGVCRPQQHPKEFVPIYVNIDADSFSDGFRGLIETGEEKSGRKRTPAPSYEPEGPGPSIDTTFYIKEARDEYYCLEVFRNPSHSKFEHWILVFVCLDAKNGVYERIGINGINQDVLLGRYTEYTLFKDVAESTIKVV